MTVHEQPPESFRQELATLRHQVAVLTAAVTKYQQAEEELHDSETRFRTLVEGSLQGILVHRQHKPLFANQAFATMLGYTTPTDILQIATVLSLVDPQDRARLNDYCAARLRGEAVPEQYEYQALRRDGTRCWVEVRVSMVQWDGAPGAIFLHVDLLEEELQETSPVSPEQLAESLHEIKTHLARLDDLVQDYLSLVRVPDIQREAQDLGAAVQSWAAEWEDLTAAHGVTMCLESVADMGMVAFHASTLRRALLNFVQNALDAMPQGGILTIAGHRTPTHLQLQVRDTGCGISTTELARIFEPLYTTKPGGTGLGLHIVQEIVMAHGGDVTVESIHGHGTTFTLTLP